jgi:hypothetical protein
MESWKDRLHEALAEYLRKNYELDVTKVTSYEDGIESVSGCPTCSYETIECEIGYIDSKGKTRYKTLNTNFADLICELE